MKKLATILLLLLFYSQSREVTARSLENDFANLQINVSLLSQNYSSLSAIDSVIDTIKTDSLIFEFTSDGIIKKRKKKTFLITEIEDGRQSAYLEPFSMIDFNRVDGFFLGLGSSNMLDLGKHDEIGVNGGFGYGFANERWQYFLGGEYRLPLGVSTVNVNPRGDTTFVLPHTVALGAEFHNVTSADDKWRVSRAENMLTAFWAREDFRDYYKIAGWSGYLAYRPVRNTEVRVEYRSDNYENRYQNVFYGRFGGNKRLPPNPRVQEGHMNSVVATYQAETAKTEIQELANIFGDSIRIEVLRGRSSLVQAEFAKMPSSDFSFNRYVVDLRRFHPFGGIALDSRLRYEGTFGTVPYQKAQFLGGPGSLPAYKNKTVAPSVTYGALTPNEVTVWPDKMLLLNTELRIHLAMLSTVFGSENLKEASEVQLVINNDFGWIATTDPGTGEIPEAQKFSLDHLKYNFGFGIGGVSGLQIGVSWRTDISAPARFIFRLERAF